ncbi:MAG TPA: class I adenylate-forming enzyme family protein [Xanthobacteraceae bacterium]|jgi:acyl-CoA synthetase (AMP-forming)/AMP-acid ligase II
MIDFVDMVFCHAVSNPEKPAVVTSEATLTYKMLRSGILAAERQLRDCGLKPGDRVGIHIFNAIGHMTLICALHRAGMVSVSLDAPQAGFLDDAVIDALLTNKPIENTATRMIVIDDSWFNAEPPAAPGPNLAHDADPDSLCRLILSSGTTGTPKIIGLSFEAVQERLISYSIRTSTPSWDRVVCTPGLSTNYGYSFAITTLWLGRTICFAFDDTARLLVLSHRADMLVASTQQIAEIVKAQESDFRRLDSLRAIHIGGSVAYAPLIARIRMLVCNLLYCGYGSTEGGTVAFTPSEMVYGMDRAVGMVTPWIDVEVVDEQKNVLGYGKEGEIRIRALGQGYRYSKTSPSGYTIDNSEWFYPGDQGIVFRNGMMVISGRISEIINRGGTKVAPDAIEELLKKHPAVDDVAVVGMLDNIGIEQIWAAIVSRGGAELDIKKMYDFCRETAPLHVPDRMFQVKEIPRNRLGKISRETLKEKLKTLEADHALTIR